MTAPSALPRLMTASELASLTGIPKSRVYFLTRCGQLPHVRLGRAVRYDPAAVRAWLDQGGTIDTQPNRTGPESTDTNANH